MMKRTISMGLAALLAVVLLMPAPASSGPLATPTELCRATMWAGQHTDVGTVVVSTDGTYLYVRYHTHGGWSMATLHLEIAARVEDVPQNRGGPIPGRFTWKADANGTDHTFRIPCRVLPEGELVILAHAETFGPAGSDACRLELPVNLVRICIDTLTTRSYVGHTLFGAGAFDGYYEGWCVDALGGIGVGCYDDVRMVSSLDAANHDVISAPENWDLINYLLNNVDDWFAAGADLWDLQWVFWRLSDPQLDPDDIPELPTHQDLADLIYVETIVNGEGFVPGHGDLVAVALVHRFEDIQETIIGIPYVCEPDGEETAWAGNLEFPGKNWARYFTCRSCNP